MSGYEYGKIFCDICKDALAEKGIRNKAGEITFYCYECLKAAMENVQQSND